MTINWIKCSEQMPPDEEIIIQYQDDKPKIFDGSKITDGLMRIFPNIMNDVKWIPYTDEAWKELNK